LENYTVKKYNSAQKELWDRFIEEAKNATFLFKRDFMDYHSHRFQDNSLLVFKEEKLVAVLPANIENNVLFSHQGLTYGGLVLGKRSSFLDAFESFKSVLTFLENEGVGTLNLKLIPKIYHVLPSDEIDYLLFLTNATLSRRDITSCIDSNNRLKIKSSNRLRGIKKGAKNNLIVKKEANFEPFWNEVLEPNLMQIHNQKPVHSVAEIKLLQSRFPNNILQFNVYKENEIVAGATIFETENVAHAQYISANEIGRQTGGLDFLFNYLLDHYSHKKYFDFGIVNERGGQRVNKGLLHWKETFGGRSITHDFYEVKTENHKLLNDIFL
tara:strand:- start:33798 stop:34775 length:978 start_codon:yes stop_codon:yes gene_type:complete